MPFTIWKDKHVASRQSFREDRHSNRRFAAHQPRSPPAAVALKARAAKEKALRPSGIKVQIDCMLSAEDARLLFSVLPANQFVSREVVAAFCDCSTLKLERRLKVKHSRVKDSKAQTWQKALGEPEANRMIMNT